VTNVNEDRFVHKQFPYVRTDVLALVHEDWEALIQYLRDQGIEVR
jgi:hypothetical protein